jgi:hypothetical protein
LKTQKKKKKKTRHTSKGIFILPQVFFNKLSRLMEDILVFLSWKNKFLFIKISACALHANVWVVFTLFGRRVQNHLVTKPAFPSCLWKHHHVFFLLLCRVEADDKRFVAGGFFFFSFLKKIHVYPFFF